MSLADAEPTQPTAPPPSERVLSIDALRGFDMLWIVGGDELARAIGKWWGTEAGSRFAEQFHHVDWEGFRFYDLIFPLFLFLVGAVLPFSMGKYLTEGGSRRAALSRLARRVVLLYLLGLVTNGLLQFNFPMRMTGVLPRIAICYGIAGLIYLFTISARIQLATVVAILAGYWAILNFVAAPETGKAPDFAKETNLAGYLDRHYLPGKIFQSYYGFGDNEGLLSTIPAVATTLLGVLAGQWLRTGRSPWLKAFGLLAAGAACLAAGLIWGGQVPQVKVPVVFPIIKILWTSSYVLVAGGWSLILLGLFYLVIDAMRLRAWSFFFVVIGMNAITIYVLARVVPFDEIARFFLGGTARLAGDLGPVVLAAGTLAVEWLLLLHLYRRKIFLRV